MADGTVLVVTPCKIMERKSARLVTGPFFAFSTLVLSLLLITVSHSTF
jgi:hypothetical protein